MDSQHLRRKVDNPRMTNDMPTAPHVVGESGHIVTKGLDPHPQEADETALRDTAKGRIPGTPQEELTTEGGMIRESWMSFASTAASRDSGVPSIFSARASTASALTRYSVRQSSLESPISATSPTYQEHRKSSFPQSARYCCTFCDAAFDTKVEWKLHEFELHDRRERYWCRSCPAMFLRAALLTDHIRSEHGLDSADDSAELVQYSAIRSAWGCGFCAAVFSLRADYLEHVGEHYDEGKEKSEWQHTRVIEGLLRQPKVASAWLALVDKEENARGAKLRFHWDPSTTGRSTDVRELSLLQDILEFFATDTRRADEVAAVAYGAAHIRLESNVSDLISRLYLRNPEPRAAKSVLTLAHTSSPVLQPAGSVAADEVVSPISPLPAPLRPPALPRSSSGPSSVSSYTSFSTLPTTDALTTAKPTLRTAVVLEGNICEQPARQEGPTPPLPLKHNILRRIDSTRDLWHPQHAGVLRALDRPREIASPRTRSPAGRQDAPAISVHTTKLLPRASAGLGESSTIHHGSALSATTSNHTSSVRTHTSSSTLSTHTANESQRLDDSTSDMVSDDSLSEPDSWLEPEGITGTTKVWKTSFQQNITRGMESLWARYNRDWDALVRQCMGNKGGDSVQSRESSGRVRKGTSSRHALSKGFRPHASSLGHDEEEEDDDGEGSRPLSSLSKRSLESGKKFACPFRKHDPHTYNIHDHEVCTIRSWSTISRLKEHLYRRHYKTHCPRCKQTFNDAKELTQHEMSVVGCEVLDRISPGDITTYQEKQLKSRKHTTRRQTDEEKWRDIYRLLFPNEEIPSPYPEPAEDIVPATSESHVSLNFQHFLLTEMPGLFNKTAEQHAGRHLRAHDGLPMEAIPRIIEEALHKAFRAWGARGSELPTREASVASMSLLPETPTSLAYDLGQPTAYQTPLPTATMEHSFPQSHFGSTDFAAEAHHVSHEDDSGFAEGSFFVTAPPVNFNTFAPQYERESWEAGLGLMGAGAFEADMGMGNHYRGFQGN